MNISIFLDNLRFVIVLSGRCKVASIFFQSLSHSEAPVVLHLTTEIQIKLGNQQAITISRQALETKQKTWNLIASRSREYC